MKKIKINKLSGHKVYLMVLGKRVSGKIFSDPTITFRD